jgi:hypothetical protein
MQQFLGIARNQIRIALDEQEGALARELKSIMATAAAQGYLRSGRLVKELDRACAAAITKRGVTVWEIVHRCVRVGRIRYSAHLPDELSAFCLPYLKGDVQGLRRRAVIEIRFMALPEITLVDSEAACDIAYRTLQSEIELFCAALSVEPQDLPYLPQTVINMHGPNFGAVQTGANSTANSAVTVSDISTANLRTALDQLKVELINAGSPDAPLILVRESESETAKPVPDKSRLKSLVVGIKACIGGLLETAPKIPTAIEGVKRAIEMLPGS